LLVSLDVLVGAEGYVTWAARALVDAQSATPANVAAPATTNSLTRKSRAMALPQRKVEQGWAVLDSPDDSRPWSVDLGVGVPCISLVIWQNFAVDTSALRFL
jgi:hypothetical protein